MEFICDSVITSSNRPNQYSTIHSLPLHHPQPLIHLIPPPSFRLQRDHVFPIPDAAEAAQVGIDQGLGEVAVSPVYIYFKAAASEQAVGIARGSGSGEGNILAQDMRCSPAAGSRLFQLYPSWSFIATCAVTIPSSFFTCAWLLERSNLGSEMKPERQM